MKLGTILMGQAALAIAAVTFTVALPERAEAQSAPSVETFRKADPENGKADKPAGRLILRGLGGSSSAPPSGGPPGPPPAEPDPPPPPPEPDDDPDEEPDGDHPDFFGEEVWGKFVWVLDRSGSMGCTDGHAPIEDWNGYVVSNPNRIVLVKSECIKVLQNLTDDDEFAIVTFGNGPEWTWFPGLVQATQSNRMAAIQFVQGMQANGWTPAYTGLRLGCQTYGDELNKLFFLTDGSPNYDSGAPGGMGSASTILAAFPGWFGGLATNGCQLVCVHIGNDGGAASFMQSLAAQAGGIFIHV